MSEQLGLSIPPLMPVNAEDMWSALDQRTRDLLAGWDKACAVFLEGDHTTKVCALSLMASLLPLLPAGKMQASREGAMAQFIAHTELSDEDLETIRLFRRAA